MVLHTTTSTAFMQKQWSDEFASQQDSSGNGEHDAGSGVCGDHDIMKILLVLAIDFAPCASLTSLDDCCG